MYRAIAVPVQITFGLSLEYLEKDKSASELARIVGLADNPCIQSASISFFNEGAVAQLGERLICIQEVAGSIPTSSTSYPNQMGL